LALAEDGKVSDVLAPLLEVSWKIVAIDGMSKPLSSQRKS
jgi:hypothetical protein